MSHPHEADLVAGAESQIPRVCLGGRGIPACARDALIIWHSSWSLIPPRGVGFTRRPNPICRTRRVGRRFQSSASSTLKLGITPRPPRVSTSGNRLPAATAKEPGMSLNSPPPPPSPQNTPPVAPKRASPLLPGGWVAHCVRGPGGGVFQLQPAPGRSPTRSSRV